MLVQNEQCVVGDDRSSPGEALLLSEYMHRVNNEFASAISLISLTSARSASCEVRTALAGVAERLDGFARVHRALAMPSEGASIDASEYLRGLCQSISKSKLAYRGIDLIFVESEIRLSSERCWRLALITSELISNAERHAFDDGGGTILVELSSTGAFVECRVSDDGCASGPVIAGNGLRIVEALVKELDGEIVQRFEAQGTTSIVIIPEDD